MGEIGSEFWSVPQSEAANGLFPKETHWFISGRSALYAIIADIKRENGIQTAALPMWCCESMILPFLREGIVVSFYDAYDPPKEFSVDAILVMDYFGYCAEFSVEGFSGIVIRDVTHSLLSKTYCDADYYFGSLRKWAGFWTGGFAWGFRKDIRYRGKHEEFIALRQKAMIEKEKYVGGEIASKEYLTIFSDAEHLLDDVDTESACERDIDLAGRLDADLIKTRRRRNAQILLSELSDVAIFPEIGPKDCPMFVPIRTKNRDELRNWLIYNEIFCPVHWPVSRYHVLSDSLQRLYDEELSLVCDQRYDESDMMRMIDVIRKFKER